MNDKQQTISVMMNWSTFKKFEKFVVDVEPFQLENLHNLTLDEYDLYSFLCQQGIRLEQEHISQKFAIEYLTKCLSGLDF